jgi:cytochrome c oxidase accessory protein FixG
LKTKNIFDLDPERLATTDESGHRVYLFPEDVKGIWKNRRTIVYWALLVLYLVLPWFYINEKPALMIDVIKNEFTFFGSTFHGIEPILFFLLVAALLCFIAFVTSLYGRIWCGWACPQTVFIQAIFLKIETWIEGKARRRRELAKGPWTLNRVLRKTLKWFLFAIISLHIAHTFLGYFVGPRELLHISMNPPSENLTIFIFTMSVALFLLLDFGWFREQFCIIACPYGRIQSVLMDNNSLVVAYDEKRGEPRRGVEQSAIPEGDCINCYNCVKVCPTGIDIRRGTQLECIACTQCIDACDEVMLKVKKPIGLIRYSSENQLNGQKRKLITPRSTLYMVISISLVSMFAFFLSASTNLQLIFMRNKIPFQVTDSGRLILNHFTLKITHQGDKTYQLNFRVRNPELKNKVTIVTPVNPTLLTTPQKKIVIFFKFSPEVLASGSRRVQVEVFDELTHQTVATKEVVLVGSTH